MKAHHANFHRCAGAVLAAAQAGDTTAATKLLQGGDYVKASERVKMLLARLFIIASDGKEAIDSHLKWKARLRDYITGASKEDLQVENVSRDDACPLGYWLSGIGGERFARRPPMKCSTRVTPISIAVREMRWPSRKRGRTR